jgi:hypothetical protein
MSLRMCRASHAVPPRRLGALAVAVGVLALAASAPRADAYVWWSTAGSPPAIARADLDGTAVQAAAFSTAAASGVAVGGGHVYWNAADALGSGGIARGNLDGTGLWFPFLSAPTGRGVAVDDAYVYWSAGAAIGRARLDGSSVDPAFIATGGEVCGVAVDREHVYWGDATATRVGRANLDGTSADPGFVDGTPANTCGVAVDATSVYWGNFAANGSIGRADIDGGAVQPAFVADVTWPCGVAVDATHVFWSSSGSAIGRASVDGSVVARSFIPAAAGCGVAVDPYASATLSLAMAPPEVVFGQASELVATVSGRGPVPTGTVQLLRDGWPDGLPVPLDGNGRATAPLSYPLGFGETVGAAYAGDATYGPVVEPGVAPVVLPAPTATEVLIEPNPVLAGGAVLVTARVRNTQSAPVPFGTVQLAIGGQAAGPRLELEGGEASLRVGVAAEPGDYVVTAAYEDDLPPMPYFRPSQGVGTVRALAWSTPPGRRATSPAAGVTIVRAAALRELGTALIKRLARRGYAGLTLAQRFTAPGEGRLTQRIGAVRGARVRLVAFAGRRYLNPGTGTLRARLSRAGRRLTRAAPRLKLRIVTRFAPENGDAVRVSQRATVTRKGRAAATWTVPGRR